MKSLLLALLFTTPVMAQLNEVVAPPPDVTGSAAMSIATQSTPPIRMTPAKLAAMFEGFTSDAGYVSDGVVYVTINNSQTGLAGTQAISYSQRVVTECDQGGQVDSAVGVPTVDGLMVCQRNVNGASAWSLYPWN